MSEDGIAAAGAFLACAASFVLGLMLGAWHVIHAGFSIASIGIGLGYAAIGALGSVMIAGTMASLSHHDDSDDDYPWRE